MMRFWFGEWNNRLGVAGAGDERAAVAKRKRLSEERKPFVERELKMDRVLVLA